MGPTSTWSFCRRTLALVEQRLPQAHPTPPDPFNTDGAAFRLKWVAIPPDEAPDIRNLPPLDYALYLFHTVKFHLGPYFQIIDENNYMHHFKRLETDVAGLSQSERLWFAEYLLVLAFGQAFLSHPTTGTEIPGSDFAARAMALIPDLAQLHDEEMLAIEVLSLAALYFQSIDMRVVAFQYVSVKESLVKV